jgi:hypothetical protein
MCKWRRYQAREREERSSNTITVNEREKIEAK